MQRNNLIKLFTLALVLTLGATAAVVMVRRKQEAAQAAAKAVTVAKQQQEKAIASKHAADTFMSGTEKRLTQAGADLKHFDDKQMAKAIFGASSK